MPRLKDILAAKRSFIGRDKEIEIFRSVLADGEPPFNILFISGVGGVGKTSLLSQFRQLCQGHAIPVTLIDGNAQRSIVAVVRSIRDQFFGGEPSIPFPEFDAEVTRYLNIHKQLQQQKDIPPAIFKILAKGAILAGGVLGGMAVPGGGIIATSFAEAALQAVGEVSAEKVIEAIYRRLNRQEAEFYLNPESDVTKQLMEDINAYAAHRRCVLMFDAYEELGLLDEWVRNELLANFEQHAVLVIAGRQSLGEEWDDWKPIMRYLPLEALSKKEATDYLQLKGITEPALVDALIEFSQGLPLALALCTELTDGRLLTAVDFSKADQRFTVMKAVVDRIMRQVSDKELRNALQVCAVVRWLDEDVMEYLLEKKDVSELYERLGAFSFVTYGRGGLSLDNTVRYYLTEEFRTRAPISHRGLHERAVKFYEKRVTEASGEEWQKMVLEELYHLLNVNENKGIDLLMGLLDQSEKLYQFGLYEMLLDEARTCPLSDRGEQWIQFFKGKLAHRRGRWREAEEIYEKLFKRLDIGLSLRPRVAFYLGEVYYRQWRLDDARKAFEQCSGASPYIDGQAANYIGKIYTQQGRVDEAMKVFRSILETFREQGDDQNEGWTLFNIANIYRLQGIWFEAADYYRQSLEVFKKINHEAGTMESRLRVDRVNTYLGRWEEVSQDYERALEILRSQNLEHKMGESLRHLGEVYLAQGLDEKAWECYTECLEICKKAGNDLDIGIALGNLGVVCHRRKQWDKAVEYFYKSIEIKQRLGDIGGVGWTHIDLGNLYLDRQDYVNALDRYTRGLQIAKERKNKYKQAEALLGLCRIHYAKGAHSDVLPLAEEAIELAKAHRYFDHLAQLQLILAHIKFDEGKDSEGLALYAEACRNALKFNRYLLDEIVEEIAQRIQRLQVNGQVDKGHVLREYLIGYWQREGLESEERNARLREMGDGKPQMIFVERLSA